MDTTNKTDYKPDINSNKKYNRKEEVGKITVTDDGVKIHIGNNKYACIRKYNGKQIIDIREYYHQDGILKPGKKGISLTTEIWDNLKKNINNVDEAIANNK